MPDDVEQQLLELHDLRADSGTTPPPVVRIEGGVPAVANRDRGLMAIKRAMKDAAQPPGMIRRADDDDGAEMFAGAPDGQHTTLIFGPRNLPRDLLNARHAE